jgi:hypothetical protein
MFVGFFFLSFFYFREERKRVCLILVEESRKREKKAWEGVGAARGMSGRGEELLLAFAREERFENETKKETRAHTPPTHTHNSMRRALNPIQQALVALGSSLHALSNPLRADMVAILGTYRKERKKKT